MLRSKGNKQFLKMAKIYSGKTLATSKMNPKKDTVSFLLNYSKALSFIKVGNTKIEHIAN